MARYTTQVRTICESILDIKTQAPALQAWDIVDNTWQTIFNPPYPIFDEAYREILSKKILMHYYMQEIGLETPAYWMLRLNIKMNEIMPYYNKLYKAYTLDFNPLYDIDYYTTRDGHKNDNKTETGKTTRDEKSTHNNNGTNTSNVSNTSSQENENTDRTTNATSNKTTSNSDNSSESWQYTNDTPQGGIDGLLSLKYLSEAIKNTNTGNNGTVTDTSGSDSGSIISNGSASGSGKTESDSTTTDTGTSTTNDNTTNNLTGQYATTENYVEHVAGKTGGKSYGTLLEEYRNSLINIDMMVINELKSLFMGVW